MKYSKHQKQEIKQWLNTLSPKGQKTKIIIDDLQNFDMNQFEHVALGLVNVCQRGKHPFECAFYSTKVCADHAY